MSKNPYQFAQYAHQTNRARQTFQEVRSAMIIVNQRRLSYTYFHLDGEVVPVGSSVARCDYLVELRRTSNWREAHYIELKGSDVLHAYQQILSTYLNICQTRHRDWRRFGHISLRRQASIGRLRLKQKRLQRECQLHKIVVYEYNQVNNQLILS